MTLFFALLTVSHVHSSVSLQPDCSTEPSSQCEGIVEIEGQKLYFQKMGTQGPYVVFEAGLGNSSSSWHITSSISNFARVIRTLAKVN